MFRKFKAKMVQSSIKIAKHNKDEQRALRNAVIWNQTLLQ